GAAVGEHHMRATHIVSNFPLELLHLLSFCGNPVPRQRLLYQFLLVAAEVRRRQVNIIFASFQYYMRLITFAGFPATTVPSSTLLNTTLPAPTTAHLPILTPGKTTAPAPTSAPSPTATPSHKVLLGAR